MKLNDGMTLSALYGVEEGELEENVQSILDSYDLIENKETETCVQIIDLDGKKQFLTHAVVCIQNRATFEISYDSSVVMGDKVNLAKLLALSDAFIVNQLPGIELLRELKEKGIDKCFKN